MIDLLLPSPDPNINSSGFARNSISGLDLWSHYEARAEPFGFNLIRMGIHQQSRLSIAALGGQCKLCQVDVYHEIEEGGLLPVSVDLELVCGGDVYTRTHLMTDEWSDWEDLWSILAFHSGS